MSLNGSAENINSSTIKFACVGSYFEIIVNRECSFANNAVSC